MTGAVLVGDGCRLRSERTGQAIIEAYLALREDPRIPTAIFGLSFAQACQALFCTIDRLLPAAPRN